MRASYSRSDPPSSTQGWRVAEAPKARGPTVRDLARKARVRDVVWLERGRVAVVTAGARADVAEAVGLEIPPAALLPETALRT